MLSSMHRNPPAQYHRIRVAVADYDSNGALHGLLKDASVYKNVPQKFTTTFIDPTEVSHSELIHQVDLGYYHAAYILPRGESDKYVRALAGGKHVEPRVEHVFDEGRNGASLTALLKGNANAILGVFNSKVTGMVVGTFQVTQHTAVVHVCSLDLCCLSVWIEL